MQTTSTSTQASYRECTARETIFTVVSITLDGTKSSQQNTSALKSQYAAECHNNEVITSIPRAVKLMKMSIRAHFFGERF